MSENVIPYQPNSIVNYRITEKDIDDYLFGTETKLTDSQKSLFKSVAIACNLNPFKREIYAIPYERTVKKDGKWVKETAMGIITGYQVYLQRAEATGLLNGYNISITKEGNKIKSAKIVIARKDWVIPFEFEISFDEFAKKDSEGNLLGNWAVMPEFMIKKCIIGIGFRLCFPNQLGNMPYLAEELSNMTFEEIQGKEKELIETFNKNKDVVKMSKETKMELVKYADNNVELVKKALEELGLEKENLLESDKELIINKINELRGNNDNNTK